MKVDSTSFFLTISYFGDYDNNYLFGLYDIFKFDKAVIFSLQISTRDAPRYLCDSARLPHFITLSVFK